MRFGEVIRMLRQRLAEWIAPRPLIKPVVKKPQWDILTEVKGDPVLGRAMLERWSSRR
jgi:hypothetical protein